MTNPYDLSAFPKDFNRPRDLSILKIQGNNPYFTGTVKRTKANKPSRIALERSKFKG